MQHASAAGSVHQSLLVVVHATRFCCCICASVNDDDIACNMHMLLHLCMSHWRQYTVQHFVAMHRYWAFLVHHLACNATAHPLLPCTVCTAIQTHAISTKAKQGPSAHPCCIVYTAISRTGQKVGCQVNMAGVTTGTCVVRVLRLNVHVYR